MEPTQDEIARLYTEWKIIREVCRKSRERERREYLRHIRQMAVSIIVTLMLVFCLSAWVVSQVLPFKPVQQAKAVTPSEALLSEGIYDYGRNRYSPPEEE